MPAYAFVEGFTEEQPATGPNQRGRCMVKGQPCIMYSRRIPEDRLPAGEVGYEWVHIPSQTFHPLGDDEIGEWHLATQACFGNRGAELERPFPTPPGDPNHRADVVLPDGRVIEVQSKFLNGVKMLSREETYGPMAWIYDATAFGNWFQSKSDKADDERFVWANKNADFRFHGNRPVYFDCGYQGIYFLQSMTYKQIDTPKGKRDSYDGVRIKVADNMIQFADQVIAGAPFVACPKMNMKPEKERPRARLPVSLELARRNEACDRPSDGGRVRGLSIYSKVETLGVTRAAFRKEPVLSPLRYSNGQIMDQHCQSCGDVLRFGVTRVLCAVCETK